MQPLNVSDDSKPLDTTSSVDANVSEKSAEDEILLKNEDYLLVCSALDALVGQLEQAERDLLRLQEMKQRALEDPASYTLSLARGTNEPAPTLQRIVAIPNIDLSKYGIDDTVLSCSGSSSAFLPDVYTSTIGSSIVAARKPSSTRTTSKGTREVSELSMLVQQAANSLPPVIESADSSEEGGSDEESSRPAKRKRTSPPSRRRSSTSTVFTSTISTTNADVGSHEGSREAKERQYNFNQPWSEEEQCRLEQLLREIPETGSATERYRRIANALGTRTASQVASRIQKFGGKQTSRNHKSTGHSNGTPIIHTRMSNPHYRVTGALYMNTTPSVCMPDEEKVTNEITVAVHHGFSCDRCQADPIIGTRWKCLDCPDEWQVDLCDTCHSIGDFENDTHREDHQYERLDQPEQLDYDNAPEEFTNEYAYLGIGVNTST